MATAAPHLSQVEVLDPRGQPVRLGTTWEAFPGPSVLAWLRHFGCLYCLLQIRTLLAAAPAIQAQGAQLVLIGNGSPAQASRFQQEVAADHRVFTDPALVSYRAIGAHRSLLGTARWRDLWIWRQGRAQGIRQRGKQGDALQLGATLVVAPSGQVLLRHLNRSLGDDLPVPALLARLRQAGLEWHPNRGGGGAPSEKVASRG